MSLICISKIANFIVLLVAFVHSNALVVKGFYVMPVRFIETLPLSRDSFSGVTITRGVGNDNSPRPNSKLLILPSNESEDRRSFFGSSAPQLLALISMNIAAFPSMANAFSNKISNKYDDRPKRKGPQPKDLGLESRIDLSGEKYEGLKICGPAPNCFSSTEIDDPDHSIPSWTWPASMDKKQAFEELANVINAYKPGQEGIDGGGFEIKKQNSEPGYLYAQFESLKAGYIDDFEVAYLADKEDRTVQVRSSSRVGYLDFGVNAKRINYVAKSLRDKGWTAIGVDLKTHQNYAIQNSAS